jgi:hypothetical protein
MNTSWDAQAQTPDCATNTTAGDRIVTWITENRFGLRADDRIAKAWFDAQTREIYRKCLLLADCVAKVVLQEVSKILGAAGAFFV